MTRYRWLGFVIVISTLLAGLIPVAADAAPTTQGTIARARFVHASPDAPGLDVYMDELLAAASVTGDTGYMDIPVGDHTFSWRAPGSADVLASVEMRVGPRQRVTIAAMNVMAALEARAYVDDVSAPARHRARIKVIHAIPDSGPISVTMGEATLVSGLAYGEASEPVQIIAGNYDATVTFANGAVIASETQKRINEDRAYTLFVVGTAATAADRLVTHESTVLPPDGTSQFFFAHYAQGRAQIDVYINRERAPLYAGVPFARVQRSYTAGFGPYLVELYAPGTSPDRGTPIAAETFEIGPGQRVLFAAQGAADAPAIGAYTDDLSPVPPQSARLTIINLAAGNPPLAVERMEGGMLIGSLDALRTTNVVIPGGIYHLRFKEAASGVMQMERGGMRLANGTATTLIVFDDNPATPLINALLLPGTPVVQFAAVRWAHFNVAGPVVDIYLDGVPVVTSLAYRMSTEYRLYEPKVYTVAVYPAGADPAAVPPLTENVIEMQGTNFPRTIFVYGHLGDARLTVMPDSFALLTPRMARIRFVNAALDVPGISVYLAANNHPVVETILFGQYSPNINIVAGTYTYNFVSSSGAVDFIEVAAEEGRSYTVVLGGANTETSRTETFVLVDTP